LNPQSEAAIAASDSLPAAAWQQLKAAVFSLNMKFVDA